MSNRRDDLRAAARKKVEVSAAFQSQMLEGMSIPHGTKEGTQKSVQIDTQEERQIETQKDIQNKTQKSMLNDPQIGLHNTTYNDTQKETHIEGQNGTNEGTQDYTQLETQEGTQEGLHGNTDKGVQLGTLVGTQKGVHEQNSPVAAFDAIFQAKQEERIDRKTFVVRKDLLTRLEALTKKKPRGFQTFFINYILEQALDEAEKGEK